METFNTKYCAKHNETQENERKKGKKKRKRVINTKQTASRKSFPPPLN
jgi:hypothetical protein